MPKSLKAKQKRVTRMVRADLSIWLTKVPIHSSLSESWYLILVQLLIADKSFITPFLNIIENLFLESIITHCLFIHTFSLAWCLPNRTLFSCVIEIDGNVIYTRSDSNLQEIVSSRFRIVPDAWDATGKRSRGTLLSGVDYSNIDEFCQMTV